MDTVPEVQEALLRHLHLASVHDTVRLGMHLTIYEERLFIADGRCKQCL